MTRIFCLLLALVAIFAAPAAADTATSAITGRVLDAATGLPLSGVTVETIGQTHTTARSDASGSFSIQNIAPGTYELRLVLEGYQTTLSDAVDVVASSPSVVTLAMSRQQSGGASIRTLGRTTVYASASLQRSAIVYKQQSADVMEKTGVFRVGDFIRTLPQVNPAAATGGSDTPSPGDDLYFDIRGIGNLETVALLDGHPIGFGINRGKNLGYNFEVSPTFALRSVQVTYGSGVPGLTPYSAVGGTIDMLTLEPTPQNESNLTQGYGTFDKLVTALNTTGTSGRLGYALALGTQGIDGPYKNNYFFQPTAAFDPSAPAGTVAHDSGIYKDDTSVVNRGDYLKMRYALSSGQNPGHITLSAVDAYYWDDKTGNGDQDYLPYDTALAFGKAGLAGYTPPNNVPPYTSGNPQPCPAGSGTYTPTNANGSPWGYGPNTQPDGGSPCVTPQQFAKIESGLQGAGTTFQTFTLDDYHMKLDEPVGRTSAAVDVYTNRFFQLYDRTFQLPFFAQPGDNLFTLSPSVNTTGGSVTDTLAAKNNDIGLGFAANNYAYLFRQNGGPLPSPIVHDNTLYMQDVLHPEASTYSAYFNAAEIHSTITNTTVFDPRIAVVKELSNSDVVRLATGVTTVQPYATYIDLPYSPIAKGALNGNLNCTGLTPIGQVANPNIRPERANDQEVSYGHKFGLGSLVQLTLYSENVQQKIYATVIPVTTLRPGIIPPATLQSFETAINAACGTTGLGGVGVFSQANVGRLLARGIDLNGRLQPTSKLFFDYDYSVETSALESADVTTLQNNPVLIVGSQLPGVPLHKGSAAIDYTFGKGVDARLEQFFIGVNNSKNSPAYNYGNLSIDVPVRAQDTFSVGVNNVFGQDTQYTGLIGHGVPLALNKYASQSAYTPLIGAAATELYGIPYRQLFVSYTYHMQ